MHETLRESDRDGLGSHRVSAASIRGPPARLATLAVPVEFHRQHSRHPTRTDRTTHPHARTHTHTLAIGDIEILVGSRDFVRLCHSCRMQVSDISAASV